MWSKSLKSLDIFVSSRNYLKIFRFLYNIKQSSLEIDYQDHYNYKSFHKLNFISVTMAKILFIDSTNHFQVYLSRSIGTNSVAVQIGRRGCARVRI